MRYLSVMFLAAIMLFSGSAFAKKKTNKNRKRAKQYCKLLKEKFPKRKCKVDAGYCPFGWYADKIFRGKGRNYSACIKGSKLNHLKEIGIYKGNRGSAETFNTKSCGRKEIEALNKAHKFIKKNWKSIVKEAKNPTRTVAQNHNKKVKRVKAGKTTFGTSRWKKLKKLVSGEKAMMVQCLTKKKCKKKKILGSNGHEIRHINMCVKSHTDVSPNRKTEMFAELIGTLVHEMAHEVGFPKSKNHNCKTSDGKPSCKHQDAVYQLDHAAFYIYVKKTERNQDRVRQIMLRARPSSLIRLR